MKKTFLLGLCVGLLFASVAEAGKRAEFSFYLFEQGLPKRDVQLRVDGAALASSDRDGNIRGMMDPGEYRLELLRPDSVKPDYELDYRFVAGEKVQFIVTFFADGKKTQLEIESSNQGGKVKSASEQKKEQVKGFGSIAATVVSAETGKAVADAQVFISGIDRKIRTDAKGRFQADKIPVGGYSLSVLHPAFNSKTQEGVVVSKDFTAQLDLKLTPVGVDLPEYVVLEPHIAGSLASIMEEQKSTSAVANVLGSEQISRAGDSDAASALKRASGLTLVNGRFVFIRGLGERYSSTLLNGASVPSPDPTRRVVPLDLFPTSVLDSVLIQKSYSSDRPGEFAGGTIELRTRGIPDNFFFNLSGKIGGNEGTTFTEGLRYDGGDSDFLGFDDGTRDLPDSLAKAIEGGNVLSPQTRFNPEGFSNEEFEQFGEELSGTWDLKDEYIGPDGRVEMSMGDRFDFGDFSLGYLSAVRWNQQWNVQDEVRREFASSDNELILTKDFDVNRTLRQVQLNGYLAVEASYTENHKLFGKLLALRQSEDEAKIEGGFTDAETNDIKRFQLEWIENQLFTRQAGGEHNFPELFGFDFADLEIDWLYTRSRATRKSPNERRYRYDANNDGDFFFSRRADSNQTIYGNLVDEDESWRLDVKLPLRLHENFEMALMGGFIDQNRERNSEIRRFDFISFGPDSRNQDVLALQSLEDVLSPEFIGANGFQLRESTRSTDNYVATQELFSYYGQVDLNLFDRLRINGGVRWEDNNQIVDTFELFTPENEPLRSQLKKVDMLPGVAATWVISDQQQLRASWSETISRPDFRELSPAPFTDPVNDRETVGNPDLLQTNITSYDMRWEYYFSPKENFSAGFFWKELSNPIEKVFVPGPGGLLTFQNAEAAEVYGFELELLKNLDFIHPYFEYFYVGGNYTWSESAVTLTAENLLAQTSASRPLQGHSGYVINAQIGYDNPDWGTTATLLYNTSAKRIVEVGLLGAPDKYEQPFNQLDFVYRQRVNDILSFNIRLKNLLDDEVTVKQGDEVTRAYRKGREYSLTLSLNF